MFLKCLGRNMAVTLAIVAFPALMGVNLTLAGEFASTRATARVEYWQLRQAAITQQVTDTSRMPAVRLVFVGDSITDFWLLGDDPWTPGRFHGRRIWDESFGGAAP